MLRKVKGTMIRIGLFLWLVNFCCVAFAMDRSEMNEEERNRLDTFFSNFAEVFLPEFTLDAPENSALIDFGVRHTYLNRDYAVKRLQEDKLAVGLEEVQQVVRKYFGRSVRACSTSQYTYKNGYFYLTPGAGDFVFAQILYWTEGQNGIWQGKVAVYGAGSGFTGNVHGTSAEWEKTDSESMPELSAIYRVKASVSPEDANRFILREYRLSDCCCGQEQR